MTHFIFTIVNISPYLFSATGIFFLHSPQKSFPSFKTTSNWHPQLSYHQFLPCLTVVTFISQNTVFCPKFTLIKIYTIRYENEFRLHERKEFINSIQFKPFCTTRQLCHPIASKLTSQLYPTRALPRVMSTHFFGQHILLVSTYVEKRIITGIVYPI